METASKTEGGSMKQYCPLKNFLMEYKQKNKGNQYKPVAVGRYGIRTRESIYSKELASDYSKNKLIYKNTLTVGMGSVQIDIGILTDDVTYSVSPAYHTYKIEGINAAYLRYCLECRNQDMFIRYAKRGTRQGKTIDLTRWLTYEIPVYDKVTQVKIVEKLDFVSAIITKRKMQLAMLDELVKSRFVELFGGIPEGEKVFMEKVCKIITDGTHQPPKFEQTGIPFLFVSNIVRDELTYNAEKFISEETYAELIKRTPIEIGDLLLSTVGSYGHSAIVKSEKKFCFQRHIAYLKPDLAIVNSEYLRGAMLSQDVQRQIESRVKGIAQKTLNLSEVRKLKFLLPPLPLQQQFADFVSRVDGVKGSVEKSLQELETLKQSLLQQYFS